MSLKMVIPKGRMFTSINALLAEAGIHLIAPDRDYRPRCNDPDLSIKLLKSANIPSMVALGQHDCGFAGYDWIMEHGAHVETVLDLGFDPVRIVACIPESWDWEEVRQRRIIAVSEYRHLTGRFLEQQGVDYTFLRSYGATEVFPPEDADLIVDNTATGSTLRANRLKIVETVMESSTRFIAHPSVYDDPVKADQLENMRVLFDSVLEGRKRVLLEMNCPEERIDDLVALLPAMKSPTVARLHRGTGFSVKAAILSSGVKDLIPRLRRVGATDILEMDIRKVIP